jgi:hypothetical protein
VLPVAFYQGAQAPSGQTIPARARARPRNLYQDKAGPDDNPKIREAWVLVLVCLPNPAFELFCARFIGWSWMSEAPLIGK